MELYDKSNNVIGYINDEDLLELLNKKEIEQKLKTGIIELENGQMYYFISDNGYGDWSIWGGGIVDTYRLMKNNVFINNEDRDRYLRVEKALLDLKREYPPDWNNFNQSKYFLYHDYRCKIYSIGGCTNYKYTNTIHIANKDIIQLLHYKGITDDDLNFYTSWGI